MARWMFRLALAGCLAGAATPGVSLGQTAPASPPGAPELDLLAPPLVNTNFLQVIGSVTGELPLTVEVNGIPAEIQGTNYKATVPLVPGRNTLRATATNARGTTSRELVVDLDTSPPVVTLETTRAGGATSETQLNLEGRVEDAQPIEKVDVNGRPLELVAGRFRVMLELELGRNELIVTARDAAGNEGNARLSLERGTPPRVSFETPKPQSLVTSKSVTATGKALGSGPLELTVNGAAVEVIDGRFSTRLTLAEGATTLSAVARNRFGEGRASLALTIDASAPSVRIEEPVDGSSTTADSIRVRGRIDDALSVSRLTVNGQAVTPRNGAFSSDVPLKEGSNLISVDARDSAGNASSAVVTVSRGVPPTISVTEPASEALIARDTVVLRGATLRADRVLVNDRPGTISGSTWTAELPLQEGINGITLRAVNAFGEAVTRLRVTRDTTAPTVVISSPAAGALLENSALTVTGSAKDTSKVTSLKLNGAELPLSTDFAVKYFLVDGSNTVAITATDAAGNVGTAAVTVLRRGPDSDLDRDGMSLACETKHGFNSDDPADGLLDPDSDGMNNAAECSAGSDPRKEDSDGDGLADGEEFAPGRDGFVTKPTAVDSDGDGLTDGVEAALGLSPVDESDGTGEIRIRERGAVTLPPHSLDGRSVRIEASVVTMRGDQKLAALAMVNSSLRVLGQLDVKGALTLDRSSLSTAVEEAGATAPAATPPPASGPAD